MSTATRADTLAKLRIARDPIAAVTVEDIYALVHAEVGKRTEDVFPPGQYEAPPDDENFRTQVYIAAGWAWYIVGDTVLAHMRNALGITDPAKWLAVEQVVKAFAVDALTVLRPIVEEALRRGEVPPADECAPLGDAMDRLRQRLVTTLARPVPPMPATSLSREELRLLLQPTDEEQ